MPTGDWYGCPIGRFEGDMSACLRAVCESRHWLISCLVKAGQVSDRINARALLSSLSDFNSRSEGMAMTLDGWRCAEMQREMRLLPGPKAAQDHCGMRQAPPKRRNRTEFMSGRLRDGRRVGTRHVKCRTGFSRRLTSS